ncbi:MAG: DNA-binding protein [Candidatus Schekmanbacteria bacterium RBG_13_48_7]|uniref:DNA-binding protein n=1 Tax=Candidatus Schekmanbacteria bacterium RBG_13_48_7 TaxID=1817878 RepID=A0A1F7RZK0_9BACT|nr:MAG: DNA-binding protein [Candidatus Schekmanbacteria bacterium RBG_13_48_7]
MSERSKDWLWQAERDLNHAKNSKTAGDYEWACFAAQQAAEKAIKAVFQAHHMEGWGHVLIKLMEELKQVVSHVSEELMEASRNLDKFYIPTRYPNGFAAGAPGQFYSEKDSNEAIHYASIIIEFSKNKIG